MNSTQTLGARMRYSAVARLSAPAVHRSFCGWAMTLLISLTIAALASVGPVIALSDLPPVAPRKISVPVNVTTQLYNNARQGANVNETILNPGNVSGPRFGKLHQK
jgi:hypothetical protein